MNIGGLTRSVVLAMSLLGTMTMVCAQSTWVDEGFESLSPGDKPAWVTTLSGEQCQVKAGSSTGGQAPNQKYLNIQTASASHWSVEVPVKESLDVRFVFSFKVMFPGQASDIKVLMHGPMGQGPYLRISCGSAGFSSYDSQFHPLIPKLRAGDWYQIHMKVTPSNETYEITIDNLTPDQANVPEQHVQAKGLKFSQLVKKGRVQSIHGIGFSRVSGNQAQCLLDDVRLVAVESAPAKLVREDSDRNLALGKPYTFKPMPTYSLTTDPGDMTQLTDGQTTEKLVKTTGKTMWFHQEAVCWQHARQPMEITIDLGQVYPIDAVTMRSGYGLAGVGHPLAGIVWVSHDGQSFYRVGRNMIPNTRPESSDDQYIEKAFRSDGLNVTGRYVRLVLLPGGSFTCLDEIEIFKGQAATATFPSGPPVVHTSDEMLILKTDLAIRRRLAMDLEYLQQLSGQPAPARLVQAVNDGTLDTARIDWRDGLPYNDLHREIWSAIGQARVRKTGDKRAMAIQAVNPWEPVQPWDGPSQEPLSRMQVTACLGEYRSAAVNITNNTTQPSRVRFAADFPWARLAGHEITAYQATYVDTRDGRIVSAPLKELSGDSGWSVQVPAGATIQVWLTLNPRELAPGIHEMTFRFDSDSLDESILIPLTLELFAWKFPANRPALSTTLWDYAQPQSFYIHQPDVIRSAIEVMRSHFVRNPWAAHWLIPWPGIGQEVDHQGHWLRPIESERWEALDQWISMWPDADRFFLFWAAGQALPVSGFKAGTPEFQRTLSELTRQLMQRFEKKNVQPSQVHFLFVDEPHTDAQDLLSLAWYQAARQGDSRFRHFSDPVRPRADQIHRPFLESIDLLCSNVSIMLARHRTDFVPESAALYRQASRDKQYWLYECQIPSILLDPYHYYRLTAWRCFQQGAVGQGFWSLGVNDQPNPKEGSWNTFTMSVPQGVAFWDERGMVTTKYLQGIREGIQDYQWLVAFSNGIQSCPEAPRRIELQKKLDAWVQMAIGTYDVPVLFSVRSSPRTMADEFRRELLKVMQQENLLAGD